MFTLYDCVKIMDDKSCQDYDYISCLFHVSCQQISQKVFDKLWHDGKNLAQQILHDFLTAVLSGKNLANYLVIPILDKIWHEILTRALPKKSCLNLLYITHAKIWLQNNDN